MTKINLKEFFYWYTEDETITVSDEVAAELRSDKRYEPTHQRRLKRNKAQYSLDVGDGIENAACEFEPSPEKLVIRAETYERLCRALNDLPEVQGRRVEACVILGKRYTEVARAEGLSTGAISEAVKRGLRNMREKF
ncbi:RNA polymerase sigma factor [Hungatella hathewayi]|uniref:RNA polymerase sigma factor n=1 Tax=Hungatella hathewayi TaxID=154046 RepID=UPI00356B297A